LGKLWNVKEIINSVWFYRDIGNLCWVGYIWEVNIDKLKRKYKQSNQCFIRGMFQNVPKLSATFSLNPVTFWTYSKVVSEAISVKISSPLMFLNTASSVITVETTPLAVMGKVHWFKSFI
jgi:hypothetical protein